MVDTALYGSARHLISLKADGYEPDRDGMFTLRDWTPARVRRDVEALCARDDRFDWCFASDKEAACAR